MPTARSISHKAKKARLSEKDNLEARLTLFNAIPVYPKEVSTRALSKMTGLNIRLTVEKGITFAIIYGIGAAAVIGCFSDSLAFFAL